MKNIFCLTILFYSVISLTGCQWHKVNNQNMTASKKALLVIAFDGFQDAEYSVTKNILTEAGIAVITTSTSLGTATGKFGAKVEIDNLISNANVNDYNAVVFIGGPGAESMINDSVVQQLAIKANQEQKTLAAICVAPAILAQAGILSGREATVWSSPQDQEFVNILKNKNAKYLEQGVVVDGRFITANGPDVAKQFGEKIAEILNK
ncbi:MAG: DJ-1/PfpI family protein [Patescibacteria group bacterium]|nr:DJ-1/PfpI family protein [Patescibacteria group bacterium]MDD5121584.1 DJ-1/PfpI family protein [Patescibacteria group bacterium]MDD5222294.1 DJ-1/PfpI family protein [Patescibacteria group bacterium]MDD5396252.1 DJ-1/PfpI family protein [Patescibacteria group bacterium]